MISSTIVNLQHVSIRSIPSQMVALRKDPQGDSIFDKADAAISTTHSNLTSDDSVDKDKTIENLRRRIAQLESTLLHKQESEKWWFKCSFMPFKEHLYISLAAYFIFVFTLELDC